jgi:ectoine hydroxylase
MRIEQAQIEQYAQDGFLLLENVFTNSETNLLLDEMFSVILNDCPNRILEKNGMVRSFFAPEHFSTMFKDVLSLRKLVEPSEQLIGGPVYIHQTKLNTKSAMVGDWWEWHQDYTFWKRDDGMPAPDVLTAMIFLNDVTEFNAPLLVIPGSHNAGTVEVDEEAEVAEDRDKWFREYRKSTSYMSALTTDLKYTLERKTILKWAVNKGITSVKGAAGSVLFFHGNIFHASANNLSPWDRHTFLITYNSMNNTLPDMASPRPSFIASRSFIPVAATEDDILLKKYALK